MKNINIAICDDNQTDAEKLRDVCNVCAKKIGHKVNISLYTSGVEVCRNRTRIDIAFLDIKMNGMDGIETRNNIRNWQPETLIVFVTSYSEYVMQAFGKNVMDYIFKPITEDKIDRVFEKIISEWEINKDICFIVDGKKVHIKSADIMYIESKHVYSMLVTTNSRYLTRKALNEWEEELEQYGFVRVQKSYIVNLRYVYKIDTCAHISDGANIPISRLKIKYVKEKYNEYTIRMSRFV